ncbi:MAG TPA: DUF2501 domain-containing protein [Luteibacter sp.]|jgi:hypothetical protein|nr:DUF2501 domain-containing protein [Luteibacter sp.]
MKRRQRGFMAGCFGIALVVACGSASAQDLGKLSGMLGSSSGSSLTSGSMGNAAGVIQFCMKNNYLGGDSGAASVKDKLLGKLGGGGTDSGGGSSSASKLAGQLTGGGNSAAKPDAGYADGASGILKTGDGQKVSLGGDGLKAQLTQKVCDAVLKQGKSMIGM